MLERFFSEILTFCVASLANYFPDIFLDYENMLQAIEQDDPTLQRLFHNCAFAAAHMNFGPNGTTRLHTDHLNRVRGLCAVYPLGPFDHRRGGQLILWDLKVIVDVPPGNLVLLPSALLLHGNVSLVDGDKRAALVLFSAAGLFRWVHNGMMSDKEFAETAAVDDIAAWRTHRNTLPQFNVEWFPLWKG